MLAKWIKLDLPTNMRIASQVCKTDFAVRSLLDTICTVMTTYYKVAVHVGVQARKDLQDIYKFLILFSGYKI